MEMAWDPVGVTRGRAIPWDVSFGMITTEDTSTGFNGVRLGVMISKGRTLISVARFLFIRRDAIGLIF